MDPRFRHDNGHSEGDVVPRNFILFYCDPDSYHSVKVVCGVFWSVEDAVAWFTKTHIAMGKEKYLRSYAAGYTIEVWEGTRRGYSYDMRDFFKEET